MRVRNCGGIGVRAIRHYLGFNCRGNFPPVFPGTQRRYLAFSEGVNGFPARIRPISGVISGATRAFRHARPRPRIPSATSPFPGRRPAFPPPFRTSRRLPRATRLPGRTTRKHPQHQDMGRYRKGRRQESWGKMKRLSCIRRAIHYCFTSYARIKSGSAQEGLFRALPAHCPVPGVSGVSRRTEWSTD
jgi:hypothetical protein